MDSIWAVGRLLVSIEELIIGEVSGEEEVDVDWRSKFVEFVHGGQIL